MFSILCVQTPARWLLKSIVLLRTFDLCVVTETWLQDNMGLLQDGDVALCLREGIGAAHRGRPVGMRGGGVGIFYRKLKINVVDITPSSVNDEIVVVL